MIHLFVGGSPSSKREGCFPCLNFLYLRLEKVKKTERLPKSLCFQISNYKISEVYPTLLLALIFGGYLYIYTRLSKFALQQIPFRKSWPLQTRPITQPWLLGQCQKGNLPLICFQPFIGSFHVPLLLRHELAQFTRPTGCFVGLGWSQPSNLLDNKN